VSKRPGMRGRAGGILHHSSYRVDAVPHGHETTSASVPGEEGASYVWEPLDREVVNGAPRSVSHQANSRELRRVPRRLPARAHCLRLTSCLAWAVLPSTAPHLVHGDGGPITVSRTIYRSRFARRRLLYIVHYKPRHLAAVPHPSREPPSPHPAPSSPRQGPLRLEGQRRL